MRCMCVVHCTIVRARKCEVGVVLNVHTRAKDTCDVFVSAMARAGEFDKAVLYTPVCSRC